METRWGKLLGRYEIVAEVGRGAMGTVYKARDPKIDRFVAIKTILLHRTAVQEQREYRERFFTEAQAAGRLIHPNIITLFDVGEEPGTSDPYIVMEYIEGETLRDLLARAPGKLPLDTALQITQDLAEALDYAHAQGVVHRDIKPANILVTKEGQAKIGDFGIAQLDLAQITLPGRVVGTPAYMSPEQLEGQLVDGRSDLFSLGAILYSLITGFSPFQGNSATTVCFKVANREPLQASTLAPELPSELDSVIGRALAKDPSERYQRGMEFALDLRELRQRGQKSPSRPNSTFWFSAPEGRRTWLDTAAKNENARSSSGASISSLPLAGSRGKALRSSWSRRLTVPGIALSLAAMAVSLFAWRQHRKPEPAPAAAVERTDVKQISSTAQTEAALAPAGGAVSRIPPSLAPVLPITQPVVQARHPKPAIADSNVQVRIENHFSDATLSIWIDSKLAYEHPLHDGHKKRLMLLGGGSKEAVTIAVATGRHTLRVGVRSASEQYDQSKTIAGDFLRGGEKVLSINFEKHTRELRLALDGE